MNVKKTTAFRGRSRGGLTTKVRALTDARGLPITSSPLAKPMTNGAAMLSNLTRGGVILGDKAYDADQGDYRDPGRDGEHSTESTAMFLH